MIRNILVTGAAGFVGYHLCKELLKKGYAVYGIDNLNDYYDVNLKLDRLKQLGIHGVLQPGIEVSSPETSFKFSVLDITDEESIDTLFQKQQFEVVVHLAAQAGVRYSIENPKVYVQSNLVGFINILEACRHNKVKHLVYASSSSVYGNSDVIPFQESQNVDNPVSLYAATKKGNELMAHTYSHLYNLPTTGLRFFTVYGPWGRPDMAPFLFTKSILEGNPIKVFNQGDLRRDFTYVDDIVAGIIKLIELGTPDATPPYRLFNIGNNTPVRLMDFINTIEQHCGKEAIKEYHPMQPGDVYQTYADTSALDSAVGYKPSTSLNEGMGEFVKWYRSYYGV